MFNPRPSLATLSNAMDVGDPSNFERLSRIFDGDVGRMRALIHGGAVSDPDTLAAIREEHARSGVLLDPHTAVGVRLARRFLAEHPAATRPVIVLATAHPAKFGQIVREATGIDPELPAALREVLERPKRAQRLENRFADLAAFLLERFARG